MKVIEAADLQIIMNIKNLRYEYEEIYLVSFSNDLIDTNIINQIDNIFFQLRVIVKGEIVCPHICDAFLHWSSSPLLLFLLVGGILVFFGG